MKYETKLLQMCPLQHFHLFNVKERYYRHILSKSFFIQKSKMTKRTH